MLNTYIKFKPGEQRDFLKTVKDKSFHKWIDIAKFLGVTKGMVSFYFYETHRLPYSSYLKILKYCKISKNKYNFESVSLLKNGEPKIPSKLTTQLAEFIGIMLGDGNINTRCWQITISCGEVDGNYIKKYIPNLIFQLFSKKSSFRKLSKGRLDCQFASKDVCIFLNKEFGLLSPKINLTIPYKIFEKKELLKSCIRGLFDTDGGVYRHHKNSIQMSFTNKDHSLVYSLKESLIKLGFNPAITINNQSKNTLALFLFGKDVENYFQEIGSSNPKNQIKYKKWKESGIMPRNKDLF